MKKKLFTTFFGFLLVFTLFVGVQANQVFASEVDPAPEEEQKRKHVNIKKPFIDEPPVHYFYSSSDGYAGYLGLVNSFYNGTFYEAFYSGYIYDRPPYPAPAGVSLEE